MLRLVPLSPAEYVREVLPLTAAMWAGERSFDTYVAEFESVCASGYGERRFRTLGLSVGGVLVASCKRYQRELRCGDRSFRAAGIGAVFTPEALRGRGYATGLLGAFLDAERDAGTDLVYLHCDIGPAFYERLGFVAVPSRLISLRADALPSERIAVRTLGDADWPAIERCFAALDARRSFAFTRPPLVWEWLRLRARSTERGGVVVRLGLMRGRKLAAYVLGRRFASADAFALEEFAFVDDAAGEAVPALIRSAAGDLRKVTGWLPPDPARGVLPRGAVRARRNAVSMFLPLSAAARSAWKHAAPTILASPADPCWNADHV